VDIHYRGISFGLSQLEGTDRSAGVHHHHSHPFLQELVLLFHVQLLGLLLLVLAVGHIVEAIVFELTLLLEPPAQLFEDIALAIAPGPRPGYLAVADLQVNLLGLEGRGRVVVMGLVLLVVVPFLLDPVV